MQSAIVLFYFELRSREDFLDNGKGSCASSKSRIRSFAFSNPKLTRSNLSGITTLSGGLDSMLARGVISQFCVMAPGNERTSTTVNVDKNFLKFLDDR